MRINKETNSCGNKTEHLVCPRWDWS